MSQRSKKTRHPQHDPKKTDSKQYHSEKHEVAVPPPNSGVPAVPEGCRQSCKYKEESTPWKVLKGMGIVAGIAYAIITYFMYCANKEAASAATSAANTAASQLELTERPWIKIKHKVIQPLTFYAPAQKGPVASMVIEDTLENVGSSVALNVFAWEDIIPTDPSGAYSNALARRSKWCDANRHPTSSLSGFMLFPKDEPLVEQSHVGPYMDVVNHAVASSAVPGKVAFVLVGCVVYRFSFEPVSAPTHQTRFIYFLGEPNAIGFNPYVVPTGIVKNIQMVKVPDGFSAD